MRKRTSRILLVSLFFTAFLTIGCASCADYVAVEEGDIYNFEFKVSATGNSETIEFDLSIEGITDNAENATLDLKITSSEKNFTITNDVMADADFYTDTLFTENKDYMDYLPQNISYYVINSEAEKSYVYEDKIIDEKIAVNYDEDGVLKSVEIDETYMDEKLELDITRAGEGIPGYPSVFVVISAVFSIGIIANLIKKSKSL